jgi:hypothetical protein
MKKFITLLWFLVSAAGIAQNNSLSGTNTVQSATGFINIMNAQSLQVEFLNGGPVQFSNSSRINNGIEISGFFRVTVISSGLWLVEVKAVASTFLSNNASEMPISIMSLRRNTDQQFMPITGSGQVLLTSPSPNIKNVIEVDARFNPGRLPLVLVASAFTTFIISFVSLLTTLLSFAFCNRLRIALRNTFPALPALPNSLPFSRVL